MGQRADEAGTEGMPGIGRRTLLKGAGVAAGLALSGGLAGLLRLGSRPPSGEGFRAQLGILFDSLSPLQREAVVRPWDHPSRQMVGHVACLGSGRVSNVLSAAQQAHVHRLYEAMTSEDSRSRFGRLVGLEGGGLDPCEIVIYGDPHSERHQVALSGGHLLIRGGGITPEGSAFGGPLGYGHQLGNGVPRLPGNAFAYHGDAANALLANLDPHTRRRARVPDPPPFETAVQLQGPGGEFAGLPVRSLDEGQRGTLQGLIDVVLSCYDESDRSDALGCLRGNGGIDSLWLAVYEHGGIYDDGAVFSDLAPEERMRRGEPYWHVWRIEGPGTALHFRGWPHVHASIHVASDGGAGQYVGEVLAESDRLLQGEALRRLLLAALRGESGAAVAFFPGEPHARFPAGPVTTGLVWSLDPYADEMAIATIQGRDAAGPLREQAALQGVTLEPDQSYRVATSGYASGQEELIGPVQDVERSGRGLRYVYEAHLRSHSLRSTA
ncbi:MAG: hypothetical protein ABFS46_19790 [Myxococcota bacterium]